jgi:hypothetical protein
MMKVEIELSKSQIEEILNGVLGSCYESWDWWRKEKYDEGTDWDKYPEDIYQPFLELKIESELPEEDFGKAPTVTKKLSVADILSAYSVLSVKGYQVSDMDACSSDAILQFAVLGEVVWG